MTELEALEAEMLAAAGSADLADRSRCALHGNEGKGLGLVGYNVQTAVDTTHHLIVAHDVINEGMTARNCHPCRRKPRRPWEQKS